MDNENKIIGKASGKVLMIGGYGVLEEDNYGVSLGLASHFYCVCTSYISKQETDIVVSSFQIQQEWNYVFQEQTVVEKNKKINNFVQNAIIWTLKFYQRQSHAGKISLQILFDRNFISNKDALSSQKFCKYRKGYAKTGLGSSACVIISLIQCLIQLFQPELKTKNTQKFYQVSNTIGQIANLSAQKKIGSNFDISTAVFGSQLYKNILPHKILNLLPKMDSNLMQKLSQIDPQITMVKKPAQELFAYIVDINKSADTRSMVKSFTSELKKQSQQIQQYFFKQSKQLSIELFETINSFHENFTNQSKLKCQQLNKKHRVLQQKYTQITGVPIEPSDLTTLIDQICSIDSVLYSICPGSGGYDAIFVLSSSSIEKQLGETVQKYGEVRKVQIQFQGDSALSQNQRNQIKEFLKKKQENNL